MKEEFVPYFIAGKEIAVEITYHQAWKFGTLDYENKQFIPNGEIINEEPMTKVYELQENRWDYPIACSLGMAMPSVNADAFREIVIDEVL